MTAKDLKPIDQDTELKTIKSTEIVTPMTLLTMATEQGADLDKMQQLMEMQMTWEANEAKKAFVVAMSKFRAECPTITKDKAVSYNDTSYKHASLAGAIAQIKDLLGKNGLSHSWSTTQLGSLITVICTVTHSQGHSESTSLMSDPDKSGGKNSIQAIGSTVSYLERYTLFSILGLASEDQDDDGNTSGSELITEAQVETLRSLITKKGADTGRFLKYIKADDVASILMVNYGKAHAALSEFEAAK